MSSRAAGVVSSPTMVSASLATPKPEMPSATHAVTTKLEMSTGVLKHAATSFSVRFHPPPSPETMITPAVKMRMLEGMMPMAASSSEPLPRMAWTTGKPMKPQLPNITMNW